MILIGIVAIFAAVKLIHFKHLKHRIVAIFVILLLLFFYLSFSGVVNNSDIDLKSPTGFVTAFKAYGSWIGDVTNNIRTLTGNAIKMDWSSKS